MVQSVSIEQAVEDVLARLPAHIHLGMPLGLGKPNRFVNALYQRIAQLPERQLTIYTALSLGRPSLGDGLQRRFLEPFVERVFADYEELTYLADLRHDQLPPNIRVEQFFMQPGSLLHSEAAQQDYISSNYSHAARDINAKGLNLVAQLVASSSELPDRLSLSCNPDITLDLLPMIAKRRAAGETILMLGQVHTELPYMPGDAELPIDAFDLLIDEAEQRRQDRHRRIQPGQDIRQRHADLHRPCTFITLGATGQAHQAAQSLDHEVIARALGVGPGLTKAGDRAVDQVRIDRLQRLVIQPISRQATDLEVFNEDV